MSKKRLIETAFPLAEASAASLHEKNMRHGHISTLHLWPARRPLAASRAAIATALLPDPESDAERGKLVRRLSGRLVPKKKTRAENEGNVESEKVVAEGGILWWGNEAGPDLTWFRDAILRANGGRAPRVLDPFAGGGAIPLEAMRLGCDVTANDLNPVAWFVLKCTLEYPQKLAGDRRPLPEFALKDAKFMDAFLRAQGMKPGGRLNQAIAVAEGANGSATGFLELDDHPWMRADLGWHIKAWGQWVEDKARQELARRYPTYADWMALDLETDVKPRAPQLLVPDPGGQTSVKELNSGLTAEELSDRRKPRWVAKPTVAYLWARTASCSSCRATIPLLKTTWLCKKDGKRARLKLEPLPDQTGLKMSVEQGVPLVGSSPSARLAADRQLGLGTLYRVGAKCPCCGQITSLDDLRYDSAAGRLSTVMTAVIVEGPQGKEYRRPQPHEEECGVFSDAEVSKAFEGVPFGRPSELIPLGGSRTGGGTRFSTPPYGLTQWQHLFLPRQLVSMATFIKIVRRVPAVLNNLGIDGVYAEAITAYLALSIDRMADYGSLICSWNNKRENLRGTFARYAIPLVWDFTETSPLSSSTGNFLGAVDWIAKAAGRNALQLVGAGRPDITNASATSVTGTFDAIITDPPYYDAIPYSDLMDFFYVWLRRTLWGLSQDFDTAFGSSSGPKWDHAANDGELIDEASRFGGNKELSKRNFENGMAAVFKRCNESLRDDGIFVVVFANKNPDAWETLVSAAIRAGFVVEGSLPIQTERSSRPNALASAALSSSVWLICRKRSASARPGFSGRVLEQMRANIQVQMHRFWDAGIKGPDFVWAATGPALEAYSRHPVVFRESSTSGTKERMPVDEFLREVRRIVVEFAVGRVLNASEHSVDGSSLDDVTTYYVLHRDSFGLGDAPIGACILYALSCGVSDNELTDRFGILTKTGGRSSVSAMDEEDGDNGSDDVDDDAGENEESTGGGSSVRLCRWDQRKRRNLGVDCNGARPAPLIDRVHRAMQLWRAGDVSKVNSFLDQAAVARDPLFAHLIQALIELARREGNGDEAVLLESISNHLQSRSGISAIAQASLVL